MCCDSSAMFSGVCSVGMEERHANTSMEIHLIWIESNKVGVHLIAASVCTVCTGLYLIRFKSPKSFALSVCISARNSKFVHHVLEDTAEGFMLNKNDLTQTCWYTVLLFRNTI